MSTTREEELTPVERRLRVLRLLEMGQRLSGRRIAQLTGLQPRSVRAMMVSLSLRYPLAQDEDMHWYWIDGGRH